MTDHNKIPLEQVTHILNSYWSRKPAKGFITDVLREFSSDPDRLLRTIIKLRDNSKYFPAFSDIKEVWNSLKPPSAGRASVKCDICLGEGQVWAWIKNENRNDALACICENAILEQKSIRGTGLCPSDVYNRSGQ